ncbi:MAG: sulfite exporter TauE/SafE family protein [Bacteroides sp.]|nr:sulfite exporter TauE/SafE family protein [Bacteroides sp.]
MKKRNGCLQDHRPVTGREREDCRKVRSHLVGSLHLPMERQKGNIAYTALGIVLILILREGTSLFGIQKFIGKYGELILGPALVLIGMFMLFGNKLKLPSFGFSGNGEGLARKGGWGALLLGMLFAMAFCPTSGVFYFGMLIPMSATTTAGYLLPVLFAVATALPVLTVAWILAFSVQHIGSFYGKMQTVQKWLNRIVGGVFMAIGVYYCVMMY